MMITFIPSVAVSDAEKEKISEEIIDAMLEPEEPAADKTPDDGQKSSEKDQKSTDDANTTENAPVSAESDKTTETDMVTEETSAATDTETEVVAKQLTTTDAVAVAPAPADTETEVVAKQPTTTDAVAVAPAVDEKGDIGQSDASDKATVSAAETGAGDATVQTGTLLCVVC